MESNKTRIADIRTHGKIDILNIHDYEEGMARELMALISLEGKDHDCKERGVCDECIKLLDSFRPRRINLSSYCAVWLSIYYRINVADLVELIMTKQSGNPNNL